MRLRLAWACALAFGGCAFGALAEVEPSSWPPAAQSRQATPAASSAARLYVMTFRDVPVGEVAGAVLGDALHLPYDVGAKVDGVMTFEVAERLTPEQLLASFEAALRSQGVAMRDTGSQIALVPLAEATAAAHAPVAGAAKVEVSDPAQPSRAEGWRVFALLAACAGVGAASAVWMARRARRTPRSAAREAVISYLVESGAVSGQQVARARLVARREDRPVERVLERDTPLPAGALLDAYSAASGAAIWRPGALQPLDPQPRFGGEAIGDEMIVLAQDESQLTVATADPLDDAATARLVFASGRSVRLMVATPEDIAWARRSLRSLHVVGLVAG